MKPFSKRRAPGDPGESGALNDLSFLLIVFFIVIAGFNVNKGFLINLPDASRPRLVHDEDLVRCGLTAAGDISLEGKTVTVEDLRNEILAKKAKYPNMTFLLVVDPDAPWQSVVNVIHEIRRLNVENFSFRMDGGGS